MNNREFFNSMAEKWDSTVDHDEKKIGYIVDIARIKQGDRTLDVGTGTGVMVPFLYSRAGLSGKIVAVDIAENMIEVAKGKFRFNNVEFIAGDALAIKLPENYFDCIMCYSMFPHFEDKKAAVAKLAGYLNRGGKLCISHSQGREAINNLHRNVSGAVKNDRLPSADIIKQYYKEAGLKTAAVVDNDEMFVVVGCNEAGYVK